MKEWAERECRIACQRENPNYDFDSDDFDYGCNCYKSALKAYNSLMDDGHSGMSFSLTRSILTRLMKGLPLTPIRDEDFKEEENCYGELPEDLAKRGLKSDIQCSRMSSLFRKETLDGKVTYRDIDRCVMIDVEEPSSRFSSGCDRVIDEMFPITMPYNPQPGKFEIYAQTFLVDKAHGDFDTRALLYVITPDGKRIDLNIYQTDDDKGGWKRITKEEYDALFERRLDKLNEKIADHLIWTLISNSSPDNVIVKLEEAYDKKDESTKERYRQELAELCKFYLNPENYKYNTFSMSQSLCKDNSDAYKGVAELCVIAEYLKSILASLKV